MKRTDEGTAKGKNTRKRTIWLIVAGAAVVLLAVVGFAAGRIFLAPQDLFKLSTIDPALLASATPAPTPEPEPTSEPEATGSGEPATATPSPTPTPEPTPGITETKEILNILLVGIDRRASAKGNDAKGTPKSEGTDPHADVQMVVSINFKEKKVDLISLPRDTFVFNRDLMDGLYKLNATFNVGGGFDAADGAGFMNICKGAEYMLGGVPVNYYYAVDFKTLVKLVDAIGGVDYDPGSPSYSRRHKRGMQHMNGQDVLFYVRIRKVGPAPGDPNRVNRQKDMMVAIFSQLKKKGKLSMAPELINTANSGVFTNTNLEQTLALANFAMSIDPKKIGMHSMVGPSADALGLRWCFTDQEKRVKLIKQVYGINVPEQVRCSQKFATWLRNYGFTGLVYQSTAKQVLDYADTRKAEFTADQQKAYDTLAASLTNARKAWDLASLTFKSADIRALKNADAKLKTGAANLAKLLNYKEKLTWTYNSFASSWAKDPKINKVWVDPR